MAQRSQRSGRAKLDQFLLGYTRTTLRRACTQTKRQDNGPNVTVWLYRLGEWDQLPDEQVEGLWAAQRFQSDRSLCGLLLKDVFQLSAKQYKDVRTAFESTSTPGPTGIYKSNDGSMDYAIVVELPDESASNPNIQTAGIAALAALAAGSVVGGLTKTAYERKLMKHRDVQARLTQASDEKEKVATLLSSLGQDVETLNNENNEEKAKAASSFVSLSQVETLNDEKRALQEQLKRAQERNAKCQKTSNEWKAEARRLEKAGEQDVHNWKTANQSQQAALSKYVEQLHETLERADANAREFKDKETEFEEFKKAQAAEVLRLQQALDEKEEDRKRTQQAEAAYYQYAEQTINRNRDQFRELETKYEQMMKQSERLKLSESSVSDDQVCKIVSEKLKMVEPRIRQNINLSRPVGDVGMCKDVEDELNAIAIWIAIDQTYKSAWAQSSTEIRELKQEIDHLIQENNSFKIEDCKNESTFEGNVASIRGAVSTIKAKVKARVEKLILPSVSEFQSPEYKDLRALIGKIFDSYTTRQEQEINDALERYKASENKTFEVCGDRKALAEQKRTNLEPQEKALVQLPTPLEDNDESSFEAGDEQFSPLLSEIVNDVDDVFLKTPKPYSASKTPQNPYEDEETDPNAQV